jgi:hypothetical protein
LSLYIEECVVRGVVSGITIAGCTYTSPDIITAVIIYTFLDSFEVTSFLKKGCKICGFF